MGILPRVHSETSAHAGRSSRPRTAIPVSRKAQLHQDFVMHATANLPLFFEGVHYDLKLRSFTEDLAFWSKQVRKYGGPVLELACGTGRVSIHLAKAGHHVTGIDASGPLLREAIRKSLRLRLQMDWVNDDVRGFDLKTKFPLIIFPLNAISILWEPQDLEACFACVKRHLAPKGKLVIDYFNPNLEILSRDPNQRHFHSRYPGPGGKGMVQVTESNSYDAATQINHVCLYHEFPRGSSSFVEEIDVRIFFPQELSALLKYNGFLVEARYGSYDESIFDTQSTKHLIVCSVPS
jgi:SAM-dependent methyltransferase